MDMNSTKEIMQKMEDTKVVAVTCLGISSPLLTNKRFDICIMDEAGQITLPVMIYLQRGITIACFVAFLIYYDEISTMSWCRSLFT